MDAQHRDNCIVRSAGDEEILPVRSSTDAPSGWPTWPTNLCTIYITFCSQCSVQEMHALNMFAIIAMHAIKHLSPRSAAALDSSCSLFRLKIRHFSPLYIPHSVQKVLPLTQNDSRQKQLLLNCHDMQNTHIPSKKNPSSGV